VQDRSGRRARCRVPDGRHQPAAEAAAAPLGGDGEAADPDRRHPIGRRDQAQIADKLAGEAQQQMQRLEIMSIEVGIRRALLDDEDLLAQAERLVEEGRREFVEAVPARLDVTRRGGGI
jgi:hypothetical protein